jgi:4-amino-4-deoxy-L-arabinose transferase-like glycosyltransferase
LPIGVVGFPLIAYVLLWCRWRLPFQLSLPLGLPVFAALWLPWVIYIYVHLGADALYRWRAEFVDRATGELPNVAGHAATVLNYVGYYIPVIAAFVMPWTLSLPHALALPFRRHAPAARAPATFLLVWTASIWLFFTLSVGKENRYILAALPPACALLGVYFSALFRSTRHSVPADLESEIQNPKSKIQNRRALPFACLAIILAVVTGAVGGGFGLLEWARHNQPDAAPMLLWRYIPIGVLLALGFSTAAILYLRRREERAFAAICATMALAWTGTWIWLMPIVGGERPAIEVAAVLQKAELRHVDLYYLGVQDARVIYYSGRHIPRIVSSIEMFRLTGGRRNLPREHEEIGRATVLKLRDTSRSVVFVSGEPEFKLLKRGLDEVGQLEGLPLYEWFHTSGTNAKHRLVLFGNIPPPANW